MTIACEGPDPALGIALRLSTYVDCQARALGENGFQALVGGPVVAGLLSGLVTIFVALIGYRFLLGQRPSLVEGVGWAVRLGVVLTLTTGWPAFQTLAYNVAVDGPGELASAILPASGLPSTDLDGRVQQAYDTMRLGIQSPDTRPTTPAPAGAATATPQLPSQPQPQPASPSPTGRLPKTASAFVISTSGAVAALRISIGFLLAIGPFAALALLFEGTSGVFVGWVRALAGAGLALTAATTVTAIDLLMVEGELGNAQAYGQGMVSEAFDPQALTTLVLLFALVMVAVVLLAMRVAGGFKFPSRTGAMSYANHSSAETVLAQAGAPTGVMPGVAGLRAVAERPRAALVADALVVGMTRDRQSGFQAVASVPEAAGSRRGPSPLYADQPLATAGNQTQSRRRTAVRRTRSSSVRDARS